MFELQIPFHKTDKSCNELNIGVCAELHEGIVTMVSWQKMLHTDVPDTAVVFSTTVASHCRTAYWL